MPRPRNAPAKRTGIVTLTFAFERPGAKGAIVVRRTGEEPELLPTHTLFPGHPADIRTEINAGGKEDQIVDWRQLLNLADSFPSGPGLPYGLPLLVLLAIHRDSPEYGQEGTGVTTRELKKHFGRLVPSNHAHIATKLKQWHKHALDRDPLIEITEGLSKGKASVPASFRLKPWVKVVFTSFQKNGQSSPSGSAALAAEWRAAVLAIASDSALATTSGVAAHAADVALAIVREESPADPTDGGQADLVPLPGSGDEPSRAELTLEPVHSRPVSGQSTWPPMRHFCDDGGALLNLGVHLSGHRGAPWVLVTGLPGAGKTWLVREYLAREVVQSFPDGAAFISGGLLAFDPIAVSSGFGWQPTPGSSTREDALNWFAREMPTKRAILVIDDFTSEDLDPRLIPIVDSAYRLIVISRSRRLRKYCRPVPGVLSLDPWHVVTASEYLQSCFLEEGTVNMEELAGLYGGFPLAMRLLVRHLADCRRSAWKLQRKLKPDPIKRLDQAAREGEETVGEAMAAACAGLSEMQWRLLFSAAACAPSTSEKNVLLTSGIEIGDDADSEEANCARDALCDLADRGLIRDDMASYEVHTPGIVRLYVRSLSGSQEARRKHSDFVRSLVRMSDDLAFLEGYAADRAESRKHPYVADEDIDEVLAAVEDALAQNDGATAFDLIDTVGYRMIELGNEQILYIPLKAITSTQLDPRRRADLHSMLGGCLMTMEKYDLASTRLVDACKGYEALGHETNRGIALLRLGLCSVFCNRIDEGEQYIYEAAVLIEGQGISRIVNESYRKARRALDDEDGYSSLLPPARALLASLDWGVLDEGRLPLSPERLLEMGLVEKALSSINLYVKALTEAGSVEEMAVKQVIWTWALIKHAAACGRTSPGVVGKMLSRLMEATEHTGKITGVRHQLLSAQLNAMGVYVFLSRSDAYDYSISCALSFLDSAINDADELAAFDNQERLSEVRRLLCEELKNHGFDLSAESAEDFHTSSTGARLPENFEFSSELMSKAMAAFPLPLRYFTIDRKPTQRDLRICEPWLAPSPVAKG